MTVVRRLGPAQRSQVLIGGPDAAAPRILFETDRILLEAPNWSLDGRHLFLNGDGLLWRLGIDRIADGVTPVPFRGLPPLNNDHVLDPDGRHVFMSADDGHIYRGALVGGDVVRITADDGRRHFLHGVSGDGSMLAYVEIDSFERPGRLMVLPSGGGAPAPIVTGPGHVDGPEWSPDGEWILYNTEEFTDAPGHAQLARVAGTGGASERLVTSETVDWFPHLSPDGRWGSYLAFPGGTLGHPADLDVVVHVVASDDWGSSRQRYPLRGGQGTINVNSWAPDSRQFAFVAYPMS
jgi:Tol biopolymer transport system component